MPNRDTLTASPPRRRFGLSFVLKACIFVTGLAGIVAEYIMSTLASYLLGNAVLQWTLTISIMLFAMGVGSRLSKHIRGALLDAFIVLEIALSLLCATSAMFTYFIAGFVTSLAPIIYSLAFAIGLLIGMELPLAARLNDFFEDLRINISSVMEKDYYGALIGGLLFAFVALPKLGLTYTPVILGTLNFLVAFVLFWQYRHNLRYRAYLMAAMAVTPVLLGALFYFAEPIVLFGEQQKYRDKIIYQEQTPYQRIVITEWKGDYWLYLNGSEQFSSFDEERYHEPLVHPAMQVAVKHENVLILGGGDGLAAREVLKYEDVQKITLVDIDPAMTRLAREHPVLLAINRESLGDPKVQVLNQDAFIFLQNTANLYDVIIIDLPDPKTVELARLYTRQFYELAARHTIEGGTLVTQATSPFFTRQVFLSILRSMRAAGMPAVAYHNNIPTMGEWGWVLAMKTRRISSEQLKTALANLSFAHIRTRFLNQDAMLSMLLFGKGSLEQLDSIEINDEHDLAVYRYYQQGRWDVY